MGEGKGWTVVERVFAIIAVVEVSEDPSHGIGQKLAVFKSRNDIMLHACRIIEILER